MNSQCPHCGAKIHAQDKYSGKKGKCPVCYRKFFVEPEEISDESTITEVNGNEEIPALQYESSSDDSSEEENNTTGPISNFFSFKRMLTPILIRFLFIIIVGICLYFPCKNVIDLSEAASKLNVQLSIGRIIWIFVPWILAIVGVRLILEVVIVLFRINETLTDILEALRDK